MYSAAEQFLIDFHAVKTGATALAFADVPVTCGGRLYPSSYHVLAQAVASWPLSVLDLACGDGHLLAMLAARQQAGLALAGIDMSAAELAQAAHRLRGAATLFEGRAQSLPFADAAFDIVLSHLALMLMDDLPAVLAEVHRVIKPAGMLCAVTGSGAPPSPALSTYLELLTRYRSEAAVPVIRLGDARVRSEEGLRELLAARFTDVSTQDIRFTLRLLPAQLWQWFERMYDTHRWPAGVRAKLEQEYLAAVAVHAGRDGKLDLPQSYRFLQARAA